MDSTESPEIAPRPLEAAIPPVPPAVATGSSSTDTQDAPELAPSKWQLYFKVLYLGLAFCFIFTGFNVAETFVTFIFPGSFGYIVLFTVYAFFSVSSLVAPQVCRQIERIVGDGNAEKASMFLASLSYFLFVLSIGIKIDWLLIVTSVLLGLSAGLLWNSEGVWLTRTVSDYTSMLKHGKDVNIIGTATGIFFTMDNVNGIVGNTIAIIVLSLPSTDGQATGSLDFLIWVMAGITGIGCLLLLFTPPCKPAKKLDVPEARKSFREGLYDFYLFIKMPKTIFLTPYYISQGVNIAYNFGNFPLFVSYVMEGTGESSSKGIAIVFLVYSVASFIGSFIWGKLYDFCKSNIIPLLLFHFLFVAAEFTLLILTVLLPIPYPTAIYPVLMIIGFMLGLVDYITNAIINNCNSHKFTAKETSKAFSWYRFVFCLGFCAASGLSAGVPGIEVYKSAMGLWDGVGQWGWLLLIVNNLFWAALAIVCGFYLELGVYRQMKAQVAPSNNEVVEMVETRIISY